MKPTCCNHDCRSGRDCPLRQPPNKASSRAERIWAGTMLAAAVLALLLANPALADRYARFTMIYLDQGDAPRLWIDPETGCEYLVQGGRDIIPRSRGFDQKQVCHNPSTTNVKETP